MSDRVDLSDLDKKLKLLSRGLISAAGGVEHAPSCPGLRVEKSTLGNYQSLNHRQFMPVDVLICLTEATGNPQLLEEVARRCGYRIEPIGKGGAGTAMQHAAAVARESAEVMMAIATGMADGRLCGTDLARVEAEMLDVVREASSGVAAARAARAAVAEGDGA